jgi:NADH:ubiquinone oxidoreductase subunit F (NADH-binding)
MAADVTRPGVTPGGQAQRLLAGYLGTTMRLSDHISVHGRLPAVGAPTIVGAVRRSGLVGRGGAHFPTAVKLESVAAGRGPRVVLVNGAEGEPVSAKDQALMSWVPHLVLDGAAVAAEAVGANRVIVAARRPADDVMAAAVDERRSLGLDRVVPQVVTTPNRFLAGEESALVNFLTRGPLLPRFVPPRPYERGVDGRPTLVSNVETVAHLALIARWGPEWFRQVGRPAEPGTTLITAGGAVAHPGVYEVARGARVSEVVHAAGGLATSVNVLLVGGYAGTWVPAAAVWDRPLSEEGLAPAGGVLGAGVVMALPEQACGVAETARIVSYLAGENAGQCGPCIHGLDAIAGVLDELTRGRARSDAVDRLRNWSWQVVGRGACHHPDGAVRLLNSALKVFATDLSAHRRGQPCRFARNSTSLAAAARGAAPATAAGPPTAAGSPTGGGPAASAPPAAGPPGWSGGGSPRRAGRRR